MNVVFDFENREATVDSGFSTDKLHLIILPTEQCNLRCTYCYEDFAVGRLSEKTTDSIKSLLDKQQEQLSELHLTWFGGEPLTAKNTVIEILEHIYGLERVASGRLLFSSSMTTNGILLTPELFTKLLGLGVTGYQITLDGSPRTHDARRVRMGGQGTFKQIYQNLSSFFSSDLDFTLNLRVHYSHNDAESAAELIERLNSDFGEDRRLRVSLKAVEKLNGVNGTGVVKVSRDQQRRIEEILVAKGQHLKFSTRRDIEETYTCYAAKRNSLVIRADGSLAKCTVALGADFNNVGRLKSDGSLLLNEDKLGQWTDVLRSGTRLERCCPKSVVARPK